jgi:SAM-dependent methyltransferase
VSKLARQTSIWSGWETDQYDRVVRRDQSYLRDVQYRDPAKLEARANLHLKYGTAGIGWVPWVIEQIDWSRAEDVLEVGCGPGWLWADVAGLPANLRLTLTDLSPGMVEVARDRASALSHFEVVEAHVVDAQNLPFGREAFDVVVANHMLYHLPHPETAVAEFAKVLRPDGVLMAATSGPHHLRELWQVRAEVFGGPPKGENPEVFGSVTGAAILGQSFRSVEWREYADTLHCTSPEDVVAFLTSAPPGEDASPDQLMNLRRAVESRFEAGEGTFVVSKETGVFLGRIPLR